MVIFAIFSNAGVWKNLHLASLLHYKKVSWKLRLDIQPVQQFSFEFQNVVIARVAQTPQQIKCLDVKQRPLI